jgi:hypothetical protein
MMSEKSGVLWDASYTEFRTLTMEIRETNVVRILGPSDVALYLSGMDDYEELRAHRVFCNQALVPPLAFRSLQLDKEADGQRASRLEAAVVAMREGEVAEEIGEELLRLDAAVFARLSDVLGCSKAWSSSKEVKQSWKVESRPHGSVRASCASMAAYPSYGMEGPCLGVPVSLCFFMSIPEPWEVTAGKMPNWREKRQLENLRLGVDKYPGALWVSFDDGRKDWLRPGQFQGKSLEEVAAWAADKGVTLLGRMPRTGDVLPAGRSPTDNKGSFLALKLHVLHSPGACFYFPLLTCPSYGMDFDGDQATVALFHSAQQHVSQLRFSPEESLLDSSGCLRLKLSGRAQAGLVRLLRQRAMSLKEALELAAAVPSFDTTVLRCRRMPWAVKCEFGASLLAAGALARTSDGRYVRLRGSASPREALALAASVGVVLVASSQEQVPVQNLEPSSADVLAGVLSAVLGPGCTLRHHSAMPEQLADEREIPPLWQNGRVIEHHLPLRLEAAWRRWETRVVCDGGRWEWRVDQEDKYLFEEVPKFDHLRSGGACSGGAPLLVGADKETKGQAFWRRLSQLLLVRWHSGHEVRLLDRLGPADLDEMVLDVAKFVSQAKAVALMQSLELLGERASRMLSKEHLMEHVLPRKGRAREAQVHVDSIMRELNKRCRHFSAEEPRRDRTVMQEGLRRAFETLRDGLCGQGLPTGAALDTSTAMLEAIRAVRTLASELD